MKQCSDSVVDIRIVRTMPTNSETSVFSRWRSSKMLPKFESSDKENPRNQQNIKYFIHFHLLTFAAACTEKSKVCKSVKS
jgi:hypothetical protein